MEHHGGKKIKTDKQGHPDARPSRPNPPGRPLASSLGDPLPPLLQVPVLLQQSELRASYPCAAKKERKKERDFVFEGRMPSFLSRALSQTSVYHLHMTKLSSLPPRALLGCDKQDNTFPTPSGPAIRERWVEKSIQVILGFMFETVSLCQGRKRADVPKGEPCKSVQMCWYILPSLATRLG